MIEPTEADKAAARAVLEFVRKQLWHHGSRSESWPFDRVQDVCDIVTAALRSPDLAQHMAPELAAAAALRAELQQVRQFAAYCRCCAQSGESDPMDFEAFVVRMAEVSKG